MGSGERYDVVVAQDMWCSLTRSVKANYIPNSLSMCIYNVSFSIKILTILINICELMTDSEIVCQFILDPSSFN